MTWKNLLIPVAPACWIALASDVAADRPLPRLSTPWTARVNPTLPHPEYPRPQMVRGRWTNLNGPWEHAVVPRGADEPDRWDGPILVPFPVESALSGVARRVGPDERLWYRRTFRHAPVPGERLLLHFGAVDWEAQVRVNGALVGEHRGGYDPFTLDVTGALSPAGEQTLTVAVWDPTDAGPQPRGKQVRDPGGIWYTPTTGIWQTVWLEPVPERHLRSLRLTPDLGGETLAVSAEVAGTTAGTLRAVASAGGDRVGRAEGPAGAPLTLPVPRPRPWSPDDPFLYDLRVELLAGGETVDAVDSYFGMRSVAVKPDPAGVPRLLLNGEPVFQFGPLDQGFWPDGLYAAPTDEALRFDVEATKRLGFNLARKHVKVEPARWYAWCDRIGLLVWQDMPSGDEAPPKGETEIRRSPESEAVFRREFKAMIDALANHPCIVMWVPFNEGWGQFKTREIAGWVKAYDPSRLVNCASGWHDAPGAGDVRDIHRYPGPAAPPPERGRAAVLGEFGGLGLPVKGHTWQDESNWGYRSFGDADALTAAYLKLLDELAPLIRDAGLSAAVYTQTTDVEVEVNGLLTYDRALVKPDEARIAQANRNIRGDR